MLIFGMTGPIGHGKSTFAKAVTRLEPFSVHFESSMVIAEVGNALHSAMRTIPRRDDVETINDWLRPLPAILLETVHAHCNFDQIKLTLEAIDQHPIEYEKLLLHAENLSRNPALAKQQITKENKEAYRPLLQWLGGYLVKHVDEGIWYKEIVRRIRETQTKGYTLCLVGGLRFPSDAAYIRGVGGKIIKVYRPGHLQYDMLDPTERERDNIIPDCTLVSNGTIEDITRLVPVVLADARNDKLEKTYYATVSEQSR